MSTEAAQVGIDPTTIMNKRDKEKLFQLFKRLKAVPNSTLAYILQDTDISGHEFPYLIDRIESAIENEGKNLEWIDLKKV